MGIRFQCPNGHKLHVKEHLAGKRGVCPSCGAKVLIPAASEPNGGTSAAGSGAVVPAPAGPTAAGQPVEPAGSQGIQLNAPSVIIPVIDSALSTVVPPAQDAAPPPADAVPPEAAINVAPPATIVVAAAPLAASGSRAEPSAPAAVSIYTMRQARRRRLQIQIAALLVVVVIVLAAALVWVLIRGPGGGASPAKTTSTHLAPTRTMLRTFAEGDSGEDSGHGTEEFRRANRDSRPHSRNPSSAGACFYS